MNLDNVLVIGISSRALFDLEEENAIFEEKGLTRFAHYQLERENVTLNKGTAFPLIQALLNLNTPENKRIEVIVMSKNSPETGLRIMNSIEHYDLKIERMALTGGEPITPYLKPFRVDLFLSKDMQDIQYAIDQEFAAALIYDPPKLSNELPKNQVRFAFDADAVIFSEESELVYKNHGLEAFIAHERENANATLNAGPLSKLLRLLSDIQKEYPEGEAPVKIAIVTARNFAAHRRVILTLREWNVHVDSTFFLGGVKKDEVLKAFNAHIFFDDQDAHVSPASKLIPASRVPYKTDSDINKLTTK